MNDPGDGRLAERGSGRIARNRMRIAWMYYVEGLTQSEIADRLGIGRVTVVRNINEALRQREVKIWIDGNVAECLELEKKLRDRFNLLEAIVVPEPADPRHITKSIGMAAGMFISDNLAPGATVGVGWGTTLHEALQTLTARDVDDLKVISLLGGILQAKRYNPAEVAWQFARSVGAECYMLAAPALVDSPATREALIERCGLRDVFRQAEKMDLAVISVGMSSPSSTTFQVKFFSDEDRLSLERAGAVGDVLFNFYGRDGKLIDHPINSRVVSVPIEIIRRVARRAIVSGGANKVDAILGAIKLIGANVLITNEVTAQDLLDRN
ncbi:MAG: sugar-binding transcriptional regulator [Rhizobiales bacterium]|nr:sugar-binding transcriptional regulator [Hyphomicrobiales bacterium]